MTSPATDFAHVLLNLDDGATHSELTENLSDLVARVRDTGKTGTLTLVLTVSLGGGSARNRVEIKDEIKTKLPEFPRSPSIFFADEGHRLSRNDPNQPSLEGLRFPGRVNQATGEVTD